MSETQMPDVAEEEMSAGARWVDRYLMPVLDERLPNRGPRLRCLQIEPDDEDEAIRLRQKGHSCDVMFCSTRPSRPTRWEHPPMAGDIESLPLGDGQYDLVFTGRFGHLTPAPPQRLRFARELRRICSGGVLMAMGNRICPIDLTRNASLFHGLGCPFLISMPEAIRIFRDEAGFSAVHTLSLRNHFGWSRLHGAGRLIAMMLEFYWSRMAVPGRSWLYTSPLNPVLMLWIAK